MRWELSQQLSELTHIADLSTKVNVDLEGRKDINIKLQESAVAVIALSSMLTVRGWLNPSAPGALTQFGTPILVNNNNHPLGPIIDSVYIQGLNLPVTFYSRGLNLLVSVGSGGNVGSVFEEYVHRLHGHFLLSAPQRHAKT